MSFSAMGMEKSSRPSTGAGLSVGGSTPTILSGAIWATLTKMAISRRTNCLTCVDQSYGNNAAAFVLTVTMAIREFCAH